MVIYNIIRDNEMKRRKFLMSAFIDQIVAWLADQQLIQWCLEAVGKILSFLEENGLSGKIVQALFELILKILGQ